MFALVFIVGSFLAPCSTIDSQNPCQRTGEAMHDRILFAFMILGDGDGKSRTTRTEVGTGLFVHLGVAAFGISFAIRHMHQPWRACFPCASKRSPNRFPGTSPKASTASREPATIGRIGMAARVRGGRLSDRCRPLTMPLATATRAPRALDVNQEWRVSFFSVNRVGC
jgi:hypothetical protein